MEVALLLWLLLVNCRSPRTCSLQLMRLLLLLLLGMRWPSMCGCCPQCSLHRRTLLTGTLLLLLLSTMGSNRICTTYAGPSGRRFSSSISSQQSSAALASKAWATGHAGVAGFGGGGSSDGRHWRHQAIPSRLQ
jgi:hypothetical protein